MSAVEDLIARLALAPHPEGGYFRETFRSPVQVALCGCTVSPGFEFADFAMPTRAELHRRFPQHASILDALTRG